MSVLKKKLSHVEARRQYNSRSASQYNQDFMSWLMLNNIVFDIGTPQYSGSSDGCSNNYSSSECSSSSDSCD